MMPSVRRCAIGWLRSILGHRSKPVNFGDTPIGDLLDIGGFSLDSILEIEPGFLGENHHEHDDDVQSFVFTSMASFNQS